MTETVLFLDDGRLSSLSLGSYPRTEWKEGLPAPGGPKKMVRRSFFPAQLSICRFSSTAAILLAMLTLYAEDQLVDQRCYPQYEYLRYPISPKLATTSRAVPERSLPTSSCWYPGYPWREFSYSLHAECRACTVNILKKNRNCIDSAVFSLLEATGPPNTQ